MLCLAYVRSDEWTVYYFCTFMACLCESLPVLMGLLACPDICSTLVGGLICCCNTVSPWEQCLCYDFAVPLTLSGVFTSVLVREVMASRV